MRHDFIQRTNIMLTLKAVTRNMVCVGLLAGFLLLVHLCLLLLMTGCGAWSIWFCFLGLHESHELHTYHWHESPERPGRLVGISWNGGLSLCLARVWGHGALFLGERPLGALSCDAMGVGANPEHSLV